MWFLHTAADNLPVAQLPAAVVCIKCVGAGVAAAVVGGRGWWRQVSGGGRHHRQQRRRGGLKVAAAMTHDSDTHECVRGYCRKSSLTATMITCSYCVVEILPLLNFLVIQDVLLAKRRKHNQCIRPANGPR